jgi:uncharacterized membrane protein (UPF0127 family)
MRLVHSSRGALVVAVALLLAACNYSTWLTPAQALPVENITIDSAGGRAPFQVEIAATEQSQQTGLMYRKEMPPNAGMLFDMHKPQFVSFWMKNTYLSLDLLFVRADGTISSIEPNAIPMSTDSIRSAEPVLAIIELNGGRAHQLGIKPGARVHGAIFGP